MKYLVVIEHHDLTDVPPDISLHDHFILDVTQEEMDEIERKINDLFTQAGDGNDEYHTIDVTKLSSVKTWSKTKLTKWIDDYRQTNIGDDESDEELTDEDEDDEDFE